jgi:hypothetical protein
MFLSVVISFIAKVIVFGSSCFLCKGVLTLSCKDIAQMSRVFAGYNKSLVKSLARQKIDYTFGFILLFISFLLEIISTIIAFEEDPSKAFIHFTPLFIIVIASLTIIAVISLILLRSLLVVQVEKKMDKELNSKNS